MEFFGLIAFCLVLACTAETSKIKRLESKIKKLEKDKKGVLKDMSRLFNELIGTECTIKSEDLLGFTGVDVAECTIIDADDEWVKIKVTNKKKDKTAVKLLRLENIDEVELKG